ncbi:response regulator transcription factor [Streptomyces ipomoeae]|nr:response regulator transcription factor [Streptomyces ipomoeae]
MLALLAQGDTNADLATHLAMRERTVEGHVSRILTALEVTHRAQAALLARDAGSRARRTVRGGCRPSRSDAR